jgi:ABC-2 type transport system ATP-binding protein
MQTGPHSPNSAGEAIRTEGLTKVFRSGTRAVDALDLAVRRGEVFGLLGPNGAGKTTIVGLLTTLVVPTAGRAWVAGCDVVTRPGLVRQRIGVVPQQPTADLSLSVRENLIFHGRYFGFSAAQAARDADAWLDRAALAHAARRRVSELSGGMARRLMIARAVLHRPEIVFLDEPTAGLDPQSRIAVHDLIRELNAGGHTILLITHDMEEADRLSDRLAIMEQGRVLALDAPAALKRSIAADRVVSLLTGGDPSVMGPRLEAEISGVRELRVVGDRIVLTIGAERNGDHTPAAPRDIFGEIVGAASQAGVVLRDVSVEEPTLESVFLSLTGRELRER